MTTIAPNRSIVTGRVRVRAGELVELEVASSRRAWPHAADLAARSVGKTIRVRLLPGLDPVAGEDVELEISLEPGGEAGLAPEWRVV